MILPDVNLLIHAHRHDSQYHQPSRAWLDKLLHDGAAIALCDPVLGGFLRIVTNPKVYRTDPTPSENAFAFIDWLRAHPTVIAVMPCARHWAILRELCKTTGAIGNDIPDAYLAALAIESGCEFHSADKGFSRFPGLRWHNPLAGL